MSAEPAIPTCFRHPDRQTRLGCSSCGRPVCVECVRPASVGQLCPECVAQRGGQDVVTAADLRRQATRSTPVAYTLLAVSVGIAVLAFVAFDVWAVLFQWGAQANFLVAQGEWYRLFSAAVLHSPQTFTHILFNMWALYLFGPQLERDVGSGSFLALYVASAAMGGAFFYVLGDPGQTAVGASGAVFGLFGAWLAASWRSRHTSVGAAGLRQLLMLLGINMALPFFIPSIAWQAHVGGLVTGVAVVLLWTVPGLRGRSSAARVRRTLAAAAFAVVAVLLVLML